MEGNTGNNWMTVNILCMFHVNWSKTSVDMIL